jgi:WD40 repeat protein
MSMGRVERPLGEGDPRLVEFAADLRRLRAEAGGPAYRELSRLAHYSATTLSDAAGGRRLPSLSVTLAYVTACGGDTATWERRWRELAVELADGAGDPRDDGDAPYVGLPMFQPEDAERFFGRERLAADLVGLVARQRFVVVVGPSGSGKSSLLRAGLVHRARTSDRYGPVLVMTPGPHPLEECAAHMAALTGTVPSAVHTALRADPRCLHRTVLQALADAAPGNDLVVVVDQFEEVFTLCRDAGERAEFIAALQTAAEATNSRTRVVLGLRADFYAHCTHTPGLVEALREARVLVEPMSTEELRSVITQPALDVGCRVETALVSRLIADATGRPGVLPLVSHALLETWRRRRGTTLTLAGYDAAGGISQSVARTAETVHTALSRDEQQWARQVFLRLVAPGEGTEDTRRRIDRAELDLTEPDRAAVLERLAQARLITLDRDTVEVTHEALIQYWPRLHGWLTEDREGMRVHRQLTEAASTWQALQRDPGALYRGSRLTQADQWAARGTVTLSATEREFLLASRAAHAREQAAIRRRTRRSRQLLALLTVLLVVATAATVQAVRAERTATGQRNIAITQKVLSQAAALRDTNPALALQLTLAAYRLVPLPEARDALLNSFTTAYTTRITEHTSALGSLAFTPDGHTLVTATTDGTVRIWDITAPHRPRRLVTFTTAAAIAHVAVSPDGRTLAVARAHWPTELWDITDAGRPRVIATLTDDTGPPGESTGVAFSADGGTLVVGGVTDDRHGTIRFWDVGDRRHPRELATRTGQYGSVHHVAFLPGSHVLATVSTTTTEPASGSELRLWDVADPADPREQATVTGLGDLVQISFSQDGRSMATSQQDRTVTMWDVTDPHHPSRTTTLTGLTGVVNDLGFSPDGRTLVTASSDRTVQIWDVSDVRRPAVLISRAGFTAPVTSVAFSPDGRTLVTGDADHVVRLEDVSSFVPRRSTGQVHSVSFHPDGHTLAVAYSDGTVGLWDVTDPYRPRERASFTVSTTEAPVISAAISPDGSSIATTTADGTLALWSLAEVHRSTSPTPVILEEAAPRNAATAIAFSPDGRVLAAGHPDGTMNLWDTGTPPRHRLSTTRTADGSMTTLVFHPNSRVLAGTSSRRNTTVWDLSDPTAPGGMAAVPAPAGDVVAIAFSPDGRTMATANTDHKLWLWNLSDPSAPRATTALDSTGFVLALAFSPDGHTLAAGMADDTTELWDITDPTGARRPARLTGRVNGNGVGSIVFSPNNHVLAVAGTFHEPDRSIRLWETDPDKVAVRVCELAWPAITRAEWDEYFPGIPYRSPCP